MNLEMEVDDGVCEQQHGIIFSVVLVFSVLLSFRSILYVEDSK